MVLQQVLYGVRLFLQVINYALLIYCVLTWILPPYNKVMMFFARILDPVLRPIRNVLFRLFPRLPIDLSVLVLFFLMRIVDTLLIRLMYTI